VTIALYYALKLKIVDQGSPVLLQYRYMQKIVPHIWFNTEAKDAAAFYVTLFPDSRVTDTLTLHDTPSGDADQVAFTLAGVEFLAISAGPYFKANPSMSFMVACETKEEVDELWNKMIEGGSAMMELGTYPFSERYGWLQDKFGVSWQIMHAGRNPITQKITPTIMFVGDVCGKAEEAVRFYESVFPHSQVGIISHYSEGQEPNTPEMVNFAGFSLEGFSLAAMDSALPHEFAFTEAHSLVVKCDTQEEIDYYWEKLSAVPEAEQCGWIKDKFGLSWQIVPTAMDRMFQEKDPAVIARVTQSFLKMKKFDIAELERAAAGE
jgi:predicted 3-demethylubiquinone-9 3-methyltransferase (glyoxalase superfamily)